MAELAGVDVSRSGSHVGSGGMATKIDAAAIATSEGIPVLLAAADAITDALAGARRARSSTPPGPRRVAAVLAAARHHAPRAAWCSTPARCRRGRARRMSLLPAGVTGVAATSTPANRSISSARTVWRSRAGWSATTPPICPPLLGHKTGELPAEFRRELVHRDDLVLL